MSMSAPLERKNLPAWAASSSDKSVSIDIDGHPFRVPEGASVAAALLLAGVTPMRILPAGGAPRSPFCMIGVCFECLIEIDGVRDQQGCLMPVREGMTVRRQMAARGAF